MSSNDRSTSGPGGVKSLLAKFEASQQSSAPTTPNPRGRSPAGVSNGNGTNGDSARQSSTVRTTFVSVERSTSTPKRKPTPSSQSTGSPSEAKTTPTSTTDIERDAEDLQTQAQGKPRIYTLPFSAVRTAELRLLLTISSSGHQ
jgi:hypothetical protein